MLFSALVIATHNRKKAAEMEQVLSQAMPGLALRTLADYPDAPEPEEVGASYEENALIKARAAAAYTGQWSLADDAGLEIVALGGAPGLHSKRFEGEDTPFPQKIARLLELMEAVPDDRRTARFRCCVALAPPPSSTQLERVFEATCEGRIARAPRGAHGFGYDPIFLLPELGKTMAELRPEEKHAVSHRGKVLRQFAEAVRELSLPQT